MATYEKKLVNLGYMPLKYLRQTPKTSKVIQNRKRPIFFVRSRYVTPAMIDTCELKYFMKALSQLNGMQTFVRASVVIR